MDKYKKIRNKMIGNIIAIILIITLLAIKGVYLNSFIKGIMIAIIIAFIFTVVYQCSKIQSEGSSLNYQVVDTFNLLLWAFCLFQIFFSFVLFRATVDGISMEPTLDNGQTVVVHPTQNVHHGDVVVLKVSSKYNDLDYIDDGELIVKRIIGLPFDEVYCLDSVIYVNGQPLDEYYLLDTIYTSNFTLEDVIRHNNYLEVSGEKMVIPQDYYLVLGDNRNRSNDSRLLGLFHKSQILGVVKYKMQDNILDWAKVE